MYRLFEFLRSVYIFLLFLLLEGLAVLYYTHSNSYTQARLLSISSSVVGGVGGVWYDINNYFGLRTKNRQLLDRVTQLEQELADIKSIERDSILTAMSSVDELGKRYIAAQVVSNSINKRNNFMILNRGVSSGIREDMAVVTPLYEMVGYVVTCSENFAIVMSVLNCDFHSSGKMDGDSHAGAISWSGEDRYSVTLSEISKYAELKEGADIVSTGFSQLFPEGVKIGTVSRFSLNETETSYVVDVKLSADISAISDVIVVNNISTVEGRELLNSVEGGGDLNSK